MNFDTDLLEIQEMNKRINNQKKAVANLELEFRSRCFNLLKRLSNLKEKKRGAKSLLDRGLTTKELVEFIDRLDRNEWGVLSKLPALKDNITTDFFENEYPNYNKDVINQLEVMYKRWDSLEDENLNNLFVTHCDRDYFIDRGGNVS